MAAVSSPTSLKQVCEDRASAWLVEWLGVVGHVATCVPSCKAQVTSGEQLHPLYNISDVDDINVPKQVSVKINAYGHQEVHCDTIPYAVPSHLFQESKPQKMRGSHMYGRMSKSDIKTYVKHEMKAYCSIFEDEEYDMASAPRGNRDSSVKVIMEKSAPLSTEKSCSVGGIRNKLSLKHAFSSNDIPCRLNNRILKENMKQCSSYLKSHIPPVLIDDVLSSAWRTLSRQVVIGSHEDYVPKYQVVYWTKRAPLLLLVANDLSKSKFSLDISGIADDILHDILRFMFRHFPLSQVNKLFLPKRKWKLGAEIRAECRDMFKSVLEKTSLVSLTLNSNVCDNSILNLLSQLSLQELDIGGSSANEEGVIRYLGGLPLFTASDVVNAVHSGEFWEMTVSPLRKSLCKLSISFHNIPNLVYQVILIIFPSLKYYSPSMNMVQCVQSYVRVARPAEGRNPLIIIALITLKLVRINMGHANRNQILEIGRVCPALKEVSLNIDLNCEEKLAALQTHKYLTDLELAYYPSSSSSPQKLNGRVLLPLIMNLKQQLECLSLIGFNLTNSVLYELSQLPDLRTLKLSDSWISNPKTFPKQPFPSLQNLSLQYLPPKCLMELLTASCNLVNLSFDFTASDWEANALTDNHIKYLVTSGMISSIRSFSASSPSLTLASLKCLALLPSLKSVGFISHWGLTKEELLCVNHSGPPHIICIY